MQSTCLGVNQHLTAMGAAARPSWLPGIILDSKVCVCIVSPSIWLPPELTIACARPPTQCGCKAPCHVHLCPRGRPTLTPPVHLRLNNESRCTVTRSNRNQNQGHLSSWVAEGKIFLGGYTLLIWGKLLSVAGETLCKGSKSAIIFQIEILQKGLVLLERSIEKKKKQVSSKRF